MKTIINKGLAILLPEVAIMRKEIEHYLSTILLANDYLPLYTPHIGDLELFTKSGHYPHYADSMFPIIADNTIEDGQLGTYSYVLKPMNCPFHIEAYNASPRSYKALPLRFYEFGTVYRNEASGGLQGLLRLRGFTQDDGHIFCTNEQVEQEVGNCIELATTVLKQFGLDVIPRLSFKGNDNRSKYIGSDELWAKAEAALTNAILVKTGWKEVSVQEGAAFYGPKIDFIAKDSFGREWQLGTVQLDFNLPERFNLVYRDKDNIEQRPVMIHRALLGSIERFIGILLEHYDKIPFWLALEQVRIIPVHISHIEYCKEINLQFKEAGIRSIVDEEEAPLKAKVGKAMLDKVPVKIVVGEGEIHTKKIKIDGIPLLIDTVINHLTAKYNARN